MRAEMLAVERLDLDHVGAHVAQDLAGGRAGDDLREVENERVGERQACWLNSSSSKHPCKTQARRSSTSFRWLAFAMVAVLSVWSSQMKAADRPNLSIDPDRLWSSLMELAEIGGTEKGGVCRIALTDLDRQGRDLFVRWAKEAGCTIKVDQLGNVFARREGRDPSKPPVMTGSASRHPADRRQVRRRLWRDGGPRSAARAARFGLRHRGADRSRGVDQRGGLPLRAGHGGVRRVRRRLHARPCARHQGPRRRELRRGAEEDRL